MDNNKLFEAISFANQVHNGQFRKQTRVPEFAHVLNVMQILLEADTSLDIAIAGVLHDTLEDTDTTDKDVIKKFGVHVAELVKGASEEDKALPWEERKQKTIDGLKTAPEEVLYIVCADKIDNLRFTNREYKRIKGKVWKRFNRGEKYQRWYFQSLYKVLKSRLKKKPGSLLVKDLEKEILCLWPKKVIR